MTCVASTVVILPRRSCLIPRGDRVARIENVDEQGLVGAIPGEYRYLRLAWKTPEGSGVLLELADANGFRIVGCLARRCDCHVLHPLLAPSAQGRCRTICQGG